MSELDAPVVERLRAQLEALGAELRGFLESSGEAGRPVDLDEPIGRLSRMDAMQQQSMAKANRATAQQRLARVESALRRMASGDYGECLRCEEPIGLARLEVQPEATLCIGCQSQRESGG